MRMNDAEIACEVVTTPLGPVGIYASEEGVTRVVLGDRSGRTRGRSAHARLAREEIERYFKGEEPVFTFPLDLGRTSAFSLKVWRELRNIGYGKTVTYKQLAELSGRKRAWRAVGGALARNPVPIVIPCHRVTAGDGSLGGFSSGLRWKERLLRLEGAR